MTDGGNKRTERARKGGLFGWLRRAIVRLSPTPEQRRKILIRGGIVVALALLIIIPGYFGSQASFFERYSELDEEYQAWETSVHAKVNCYQCHIEPDLPTRIGFGATMLAESYLSVIDRTNLPDVFHTPINAACEECHFDLRTVSPSGDLNIPHRAHVDILGIECVQCHAYLVHELSPEGRNSPRMLDCMGCHDGEQAKDACTVCHTEKAAPDDHQSADWLIVHPDRQRSTDCADCHGWTEDWCVECHTRRPESHVEKWRSEHRNVVAERRNCEACHDAGFCDRCHGEVPSLNLDPTLGLVE